MSLLYKLLALVFLLAGFAPVVLGGMGFATLAMGGSENSLASSGAPSIALVLMFLWMAAFTGLGAFFHVASCVVKYTERKQ